MYITCLVLMCVRYNVICHIINQITMDQSMAGFSFQVMKHNI